MKSIVALVAVIAIATAMDLPSHFKICKKTAPNFTDCVAEATKDAIISMANGLKSFKILPLEPLAVDSVTIGESEGSVSLRQEYRNIKLHGLTKGLKISNYTVKFGDKVVLLSSLAYNPQVDFIADYKLDGKILLLPIIGSGASNISMHDLMTHTDVYLEKYEKNGETYLKVKKYIVQFHPGSVTLTFDNLFNGDSILSEQMNRFLNDNSDLLFKELQAPYEETFALVFTKITNDIFSRVPFNKIFPPT